MINPATVGDDRRHTESAQHPASSTELSAPVSQIPSQGGFSITFGELRHLASEL